MGAVDDYSESEFRIERPRRGRRVLDLSSVKSVDELPPYVAEVVRAVAAGVQTTRDFAERQHISTSNASQRFRVARQLDWATRVPAAA